MASAQNGGRQLGLAAFGLSLLTEAKPPGAWSPQPLGEPLVRLRSTTAQAIAERWSGVAEVGWEGTIDGAPFVVERGRAGDYRFVHGTGSAGIPGTEHLEDGGRLRAVHHLRVDAGELSCAPADPDDLAWWRVVLDSVLFTVALLGGHEALHAGAIATEDGVIAITATTGGGKSTLLSELLRRGQVLMADDVLVLESRGEGIPPLAHPAPPLMTLPAARLAALADTATGAGAGVARSAGPKAICALGEECWVAVPVHPRPLPLAALVVLNRAPGLTTGLQRSMRPLGALMEGLMAFPRNRERERVRFELAATIATQVPIWELNADVSVSPETLAGLLLDQLVGPA